MCDTYSWFANKSSRGSPGPAGSTGPQGPPGSGNVNKFAILNGGTTEAPVVPFEGYIYFINPLPQSTLTYSIDPTTSDFGFSMINLDGAGLYSIAASFALSTSNEYPLIDLGVMDTDGNKRTICSAAPVRLGTESIFVFNMFTYYYASASDESLYLLNSSEQGGNMSTFGEANFTVVKQNV